MRFSTFGYMAPAKTVRYFHSIPCSTAQLGHVLIAPGEFKVHRECTASDFLHSTRTQGSQRSVLEEASEFRPHGWSTTVCTTVRHGPD